MREAPSPLITGASAAVLMRQPAYFSNSKPRPSGDILTVLIRWLTGGQALSWHKRLVIGTELETKCLRNSATSKL
jgi:hypothetical protein